MPLGGKRPGAGHPTTAKARAKRATGAQRSAQLKQWIDKDAKHYYKAGKDIATGYSRATTVKLNASGARLIGKTVGDEVEMNVYYIPPNAAMVQAMLEMGFGKASQVPTEMPESEIHVIAFPGWRTGSDHGPDPESPDPDEARLELGPVGADAGPADALEVGESPG